MKRTLRIILWSGILVILAALLASSSAFVRYRLPSGSAITVEGEVLYKFIDFDGGFRGVVFEHLLGNRRAWLTNETTLYVNEEDFQKLWEENPHDMREKKNTKYAVFEVRPLLFGGHGIASLKELRVLQKLPTLRK
jgi:hypothetical protein